MHRPASKPIKFLKISKYPNFHHHWSSFRKSGRRCDRNRLKVCLIYRSLNWTKFWKHKVSGLEFQRSDIRASLNLSLFGAFGVGSLVAFRIVFDFWRSFKYLIQIRTFRLFSKCSKFSRRYTWHNVSAINYDFFERFMVFHFIRSKLVLNIISSLIKYHYSSVIR